ncbi:MAG: glycosyltransferase, partial [Anaerolineales bacterium]
MHIGLISGEYPPMAGGIADYTAILAREFRAAGHTVSILTSAAARPPGAGVQADIHNWNRAFGRAVGRWVAQEAPDVVNLQYQTAAYGMAGLVHFLPARLRAPFVTTFHDLRFPYLFPKAGPLRPWIVTRLARGSDAAIVINPADARALARRAPGLPVHQIPLG